MGRGSRSAIPITIGVAAIMLVVGVALGSIAFPVTKTETATQLPTVTFNTLAFSNCNITMNISGTEYCALEVTNDIVLGNPGYTVFNASTAILFDGVTFRAQCPSGYSDCPNSLGNRTTITMAAGVISLNLSFPDKTNETIFSLLQNGGGENLTILSKHTNPSAGVFIEYIPAPSYPRTYPYTIVYRTFLLVEQTKSSTISTTLTQTANNTTTVVVANLGGASAMRFALQDFSLSANGGVYPSPYMSGMILFISNSTTSVSPVSLQYFVNGTGSSVQTLSKPSDVPNGENWAYGWKSGAGGVSIVSGKPYLIMFVITYVDGVTQSESMIVIAD